MKTRYEYSSENLIVESDYFAKNDYAYTQLFSSVHLGYEWHIKNLGFSVEGYTKLSGLLEDEKTKETTFPVLKSQSFKFYKPNSAYYYNTNALVFGVIVSLHLW